MIGDTLEEIAQTKSGIIKPGCTVVSARQQENVRLILRKKAESLNCIYTEAEPEQMSIEKEDYKGLTFSYKNMRICRTTLQESAREKIFLWHWK